MRLPRRDDELLEASNHIAYEVTQLNDCVIRLATHELQEKDTLLYNALLTAFTVYARNLHKFLYAPYPYPDDIIASDYFDDIHFWSEHRPPETPLLQEMSVRVNKLSAHLSYERSKFAGDYRWLWTDIHHDLRAALKELVRHVPQQRVQPELRDFERRWAWADKFPRPE